ncbi:glucosamine--fructose-6-phosphate aminotransferase (isomerizing) [Scopulibacillus darangshiensis]|uniref:Glucosamine--fructose-6-phosphate aminotransferase (Isomerizing) n=1 Tax=Scopulibacillus darangshiensis TaxID=442528 RepID=A0A4R2NLL5_9BACL|nr:SIS domain-containing protein [Scopulibacillus darangshiensis]TCP22332.1 glucosamine--fructose-6-phosphate aminotransferase (isomerizing) [Scopulibacillus darangshiensis]
MHTDHEILDQANQLQITFNEVINQSFENNQYDMHLFIGCGTSFYLAASAARYFQAVTGEFAVALPASEIFLDTDSVLSGNKKYQVMAISRSGTTSEIIAALKFLQGRPNVETLSITCHGESEIAKLSDQSIALNHINEKSVVMTQSFSNMLYALQIFAAKKAASAKDLDELKAVPKLTGSLLDNWEKTKEVADQLSYQRFVFLGSGYYNGIAKEATLKLKEMTQTECESYSNLEFRHGPISIVDASTVVVLLSKPETEALDQDLVRDIQKVGGKVLTIGPVSETFTSDYTIQLEASLANRNRLVLYIPHLQLLAYHRAIKLGYNPDQPRNLTQVVTVNLA